MRKLGRYKEHRLSMLRNLCISLINNEVIETTICRAKELRPVVEKLITKAKEESLANRRILLSRLYNNSKTVDKLFEIGKKHQNRMGGYTRILKNGFRSDGAVLARIEILSS
jgi:large subunit ribosomal protein L17